jgi:HK97 family phage prohead protease
MNAPFRLNEIEARAASSVVYTVRATDDLNDSLEYVLSDATVDRLGDIIDPKGWLLDWFYKNPMALFNHNRFEPIGTWRARLTNNALVGKLDLAEQGTSPRVDEIRSLIRQKILRATSVGFKPIERKWRYRVPGDQESGVVGIHFTKQELLETSIVSIPANPNALQIAKSLNVSDETMRFVFGELADMTETQFRQFSGRIAEISTSEARGNPKMSTLAQRIQQREAQQNELRDRLRQRTEALGEQPDEQTMTEIRNLNTEIANGDAILTDFRNTERTLAASSTVASAGRGGNGGAPAGLPAVMTREASSGSSSSGIDMASRIPWAMPKADPPRPKDYIFRLATLAFVAHARKCTREEAMRQLYSPGDTFDITKGVLEYVQRAATAPADTVTSGWASQLVNTAIGDFFDALMPLSVYPGLSARGVRLTFGRNGVLSIPTRNTTPTIAGSFVAQGSPIPVRQGAFSAVTMTPKKMGVISTFTREIAEHSTPSIEALIRQAIIEDTAVSLDSVLLDATAASTIRPAGIRNGVTVTTATAGGGFAALVGDIKNLVGALITSSNGNLRAPVWLMNPIQALAISLTQNAGGDFPFAMEIGQNQLRGYPVILSTNVTAGMVILIDAADFASATGDEPRFDVSDQAVLHMEDTTPLAIGTAGSPNTVAAPVRSLWQTDSIGVRMLLDVNWILRRTGIVAWTQSVTW